jgi:hypothetical protein
MNRKFEILQHTDLSQIQMWLNQKNTVKGELKIESPLNSVIWPDGKMNHIIIVSYNNE